MNELEKREVRIVTSAIKFNVYDAEKQEYKDIVVTGVRHYDSLMCEMVDLLEHKYGSGFDKMREVSQGFVDNYGRYHNRVAALELVKSYNPDIKLHCDDCLFSEDLY